MLIPIKYSIRNYPQNITANIQEIAAHFDKSEITLKWIILYIQNILLGSVNLTLN